MPYEDNNRKYPKWLPYTGAGCGVGCLTVAVIVWFVIIMPMRTAVNSIKAQMNTPTHPIVSGTYKFSYTTGASSCKVNLPDGAGSITYLHVLHDGSGSIYGDGQRAIRYTANGMKTVECPLQYFQPVNVRVGCYWYPKKNGHGPFLRFYDSCGESVLDIDRGVTRDIIKVENQLFAGDYAADSSSSEYSIDKTKSPPVVTGMIINGVPADDVTKQFGADKGIYIGSIVRKGNLLKFEPAMTEKAPNRAINHRKSV